MPNFWLGLADLYQDAQAEATMYAYNDAGDITKRSLADGDIAGIQAIYGEYDEDLDEDGVSPNPAINCRCQNRKTPSPLPLWERDRERGKQLPVGLTFAAHPLPNPPPSPPEADQPLAERGRGNARSIYCRIRVSLDVDNCPNTYNPEQQDTDEDDYGDSCDMNLFYLQNIPYIPISPELLKYYKYLFDDRS